MLVSMIPKYGWPDSLLVLQLKEGDEDAYNTLVDRYQDFCNIHSQVIEKGKGRALILSREAFRYLWRCRHMIPDLYTQDPSPPFWLYIASIIHNLSDILNDQDYADFANQE